MEIKQKWPNTGKHIYDKNLIIPQKNLFSYLFCKFEMTTPHKTIQKNVPFVYGSNPEWDYILDEESTNTAENFTMFRRILEKEPNKYSDIYVVTSDFHFERAKMIADGIIENNSFHWVLSDLEYGNFREMEKVHLQNVENDVRVALRELV